MMGGGMGRHMEIAEMETDVKAEEGEVRIEVFGVANHPEGLRPSRPISTRSRPCSCRTP
jgi:hypothetical protein